MRRRLLTLVLLALGFLLPALPAWAISIERVVSDKGIEAWLVEDHTNPILSLRLSFRGGAAADPSGKAGLSYMTAALLDEGAGDMDSQAFHGKLEDRAIYLGFTASSDSLDGSIRTLTEHRDIAFDMLRLSLTQPRFDADAVERIRGQIVAGLTRELQEPDAIAERAFQKSLFPNHPYGNAVNGDLETVKALTADDLKSLVAHRLGRNVLTIGVVGDITPEQLKPLLDSTFEGLPEKVEPIGVADVSPAVTTKINVIRKEIPQSIVLFGEEGLKRSDPDWYAAFVMNYILGGGSFDSRLMHEIRVKRGLAYGVYSTLIPADHAALITGNIGTRNDKVGESLQLIRQQWDQMAHNGVTPEELSVAKIFLNGSFPLQMDSTDSIASLLVVIQRESLGIDYLDRRPQLINAVTQDDIKRVAAHLLDASRLTVVVVGDPAGL